MSKKLKIGIPAWEVGPNSLGVTKPYIKFIRKFGRAILLGPDHKLREDLDGILLPGGADVDTKRYNQYPDLFTGKPDIYKEWFDYKYLNQYIEMGVPIFCTCRGMQSMWVHFGGELHQDLGINLQIFDHPTNDQDDPYSSQHGALISEDWLIKLNNNNELFKVNSRHHQVVNEDTKPDDITVIARAITNNVNDNTVEAFIHNKYPIVAFQEHAEDCYTPFAEKLFKYILREKKSVINMKG